MKQPFFTVIVPIYNRTTYLLTCLYSILQQDFNKDCLEIIIIDDGSSVSPKENIEYIMCGREYKYIVHETNQGIFNTFNHAIDLAKGKWLHFLCDDDFVKYDFYKVMYNSIKNSPNTTGMVCGKHNLIVGEKIHELGIKNLGPSILPMPDWTMALLQINPLVINSVLFRRKIFDKIGKFRTDLPFVGDWEFYLRSTLATNWQFVPEAIAYFRMHENTETTRLEKDGTNELEIGKMRDIALRNMINKACVR